MYQKLFRRYLEASEGLSRFLALAVANGNLHNVDRACDSIEYSES